MGKNIKETISWLADAADYIQDLTLGNELVNKYDKGITVFGSARSSAHSDEYANARKLGQLLALEGFVVSTGGGGGIMEAVNRGAYEVGGISLGFNIKLPHEQTPNVYTTDEYTFDYFFTRKQCLVDISKAYVYCVGGIGTIDELTEVYTQLQTGKMKAPIVLLDKDFWAEFVGYTHFLVKRSLMSKQDLDLVKLADSPEEVVQILKNELARN